MRKGIRPAHVRTRKEKANYTTMGHRALWAKEPEPECAMWNTNNKYSAHQGECRYDTTGNQAALNKNWHSGSSSKQVMHNIVLRATMKIPLQGDILHLTLHINVVCLILHQWSAQLFRYNISDIIRTNSISLCDGLQQSRTCLRSRQCTVDSQIMESRRLYWVQMKRRLSSMTKS